MCKEYLSLRGRKTREYPVAFATTSLHRLTDRKGPSWLAPKPNSSAFHFDGWSAMVRSVVSRLGTGKSACVWRLRPYHAPSGHWNGMPTRARSRVMRDYSAKRPSVSGWRPTRESGFTLTGSPVTNCRRIRPRRSRLLHRNRRRYSRRCRECPCLDPGAPFPPTRSFAAIR